MEASQVFSSVELVRLTGLSYRQIDYWVRLGVLAPDRACPGSGASRHFDEIEVVIAAIVGQLSELGAAVHSVGATVAEQLRATWDLRGERHGLLFVSPAGELRDAPDGPGWCIDLDAVLAAA